MSRAVIIIESAADRERARRWITQAPNRTRLEFKATKRSTDQNAKMWCLLTEVSTQLPWHGVKLRPDDWKLIFMDALKRELRVVPNLDGTGFVNLGHSSSDLSKEEMSNLLELITAFGVQHGVIFRDLEAIDQIQSAQGAMRPRAAPQLSDAEPAGVSSIHRMGAGRQQINRRG